MILPPLPRRIVRRAVAGWRRDAGPDAFRWLVESIRDDENGLQSRRIALFDDVRDARALAKEWRAWSRVEVVDCAEMEGWRAEDGPASRPGRFRGRHRIEY